MRNIHGSTLTKRASAPLDRSHSGRGPDKHAPRSTSHMSTRAHVLFVIAMIYRHRLFVRRLRHTAAAGSLLPLTTWWPACLPRRFWFCHPQNASIFPRPSSRWLLRSATPINRLQALRLPFPARPEGASPSTAARPASSPAHHSSQSPPAPPHRSAARAPPPVLAPPRRWRAWRASPTSPCAGRTWRGHGRCPRTC